MLRPVSLVVGGVLVVSSRSGGWVWLRFARYLKPHRGLLLQLGLASLVLQLLGLATPKFTELIVDRVVVHKDLDLLHVILLGMLLITGGALLVSAVRTYIMAHIGRRISFAMLRNFYAHMLRLPLSWFGSRSSGDLVQRFQDNEEIKELMMGQTLGVALDCSLVVVYLGAMLAYSPALTGVLGAAMASFAVFGVLWGSRLRRLSRQASF